MFSMFPTDDPRMGHILHDYDDFAKNGKIADKLPRIAILGFPFDEGCLRNGGRPGAAGGPAAALSYIRKVGTIVNAEYDVDLWNSLHLVYSGLVEASSLEEGHERLRQRVAKLIDESFIPFCIGGGNDQSYPNARGMLDSITDACPVVINIDAHLDVRPLKEGKVHSGSPFRLLLEDPDFRARNGRFIEFAAQGSQCSAEHIAYIRSHPRTEIVWLRELPESRNGAVGTSTFAHYFKACLDRFKTQDKNRAIFVSFDLDSVQSADAPGVSCASPLGLTPAQAFDICYIAGKHPEVRLFDLSEYSPQQEEYRTGRLVAMMFYHFCLGLAARCRSS